MQKKLKDPYNKMPNDTPLPILSKTLIKSKLSKEFWLKTRYLYDPDYENIKPMQNETTNNNDDGNNINKKLKNKRVKTPTMRSKNIRYFEEKNDKNKDINEYNLKKINGLENNELENLRNTAIELENELKKNEKIIEQQKEENQQLTNKIEKLNMILKSVISMDKI